ncbi:Arylsulfatase [Planctomycetes bacterium Poly30]|uniref:Arylsulfatase n=1 Tax=Saltatorellus ferox TaxID=2528018 RepID=A0A518ELT5_9BACT|nr:Arylsulfatase [Planctomycetes bacterium Poly30]
MLPLLIACTFTLGSFHAVPIAFAEDPVGSKAAAKPSSPNVLIVLVDDLGWADLGRGIPGMPGVAEHRTPKIARFATQSLSCIRAYSAAPNCAPSRASLQTGRATPRHGVLTVGSPERGRAEDRALTPPASRTELLPEEITLAEQLKTAGYSSAHLGKWHLGSDPRTQGYDVNVGGNQSGHPKSYFSPYKNASLADGPEGEYLTTRLTDEAIGLLDRLEPPFLMHLAYYTVHAPLQAPKERIDDRKAAGAPHPTYAAMVEALDAEFGRLLEALDQRGLEGNTVVIFTSDNGGYGPVTNKEHLRGYKGTLDEGGVRVPLLVRWPGHIRPGVSAEPMHHVDLMPTLAELGGASAPAVALDGVSLASHWTNKATLEKRVMAWHFPCYLEGKSDRFTNWRTIPGGSLIEHGRWKLVHYFGQREDGTERLELYDIANDPEEDFDLSNKYPDKVSSLKHELITWRTTVGATAPMPKESE